MFGMDMPALRNFVALSALGSNEKIQNSDRNPEQIDLKKLKAYINSFRGKVCNFISDNEQKSLSLTSADLISYSSAPSFFDAIQSRRVRIPESSRTNKNYLFVAGLGRSGTTALGALLNKSTLIAMYIELYNWQRIDGYFESDFTEDLLLSRLESHPLRMLILIYDKSMAAKFVGDKLPNFQFCQSLHLITLA